MASSEVELVLMSEMSGQKSRNGLAESASAPLAAGRRERNKREKLQRIVSSARKLFQKQGFSATTTQEIAQHAEIGVGTLFLYAKSKEDLLILVFRDEILEIVDRAHESCPRSASLQDQLLHFFDAFLTYHQKDLGLACALIKEITIFSNPDRRDDVSAMMDRIFARIAAPIERAQARGLIRSDIDVRRAASNVFAIYYLGLVSWLGGMIPLAEFRTNLASALKMQIEGFQTQSGQKPAKPTPRTKPRRS